MTGVWSSVCQPSTRRRVICPEAIKAQNSMTAVSALGSAHWVFTRRLNSPCRRSTALVVRNDFHCRGVAESLEEAGERLFTFLRFPPEQWRSLRTTNTIERLHEEFKRRIKTQCALPNAETAAMLFWALMASGQITMRRVDGWQTLSQMPSEQSLDLAA